MSRRRGNPRVDSRVREALGDILEQHIADPRLKLVSVTNVEVTPDLERAEVYYTTVDPAVIRSPDRPGPGERMPSPEEVADGLEAATPRIRTLLGRRVGLRRTPELVWRRDTVAGSADRIESLLRDIRTEGDST